MPIKTENVEEAVKKEICTLKVVRDVGCVKFHIKSDVFEEFFKKTSGEVVKTNMETMWLPGTKYYDCRRVSVPRNEYSRSINVQTFCNNEIIDENDGNYDFSFIRTVGIKEGITIECRGMYLQEDLERFVKDFSLFTKSFFSQYTKKISMEMTVVSNV